MADVNEEHFDRKEKCKEYLLPLDLTHFFLMQVSDLHDGTANNHTKQYQLLPEQSTTFK